MDVNGMLASLRAELLHVEQAILVLERLAMGGPKKRGRPPKWMSHAQGETPLPAPKRPGRMISAETRRRMAEAQKRRWAVRAGS